MFLKQKVTLEALIILSHLTSVVTKCGQNRINYGTDPAKETFSFFQNNVFFYLSLLIIVTSIINVDENNNRSIRIKWQLFYLLLAKHI